MTCVISFDCALLYFQKSMKIITNIITLNNSISMELHWQRFHFFQSACSSEQEELGVYYWLDSCNLEATGIRRSFLVRGIQLPSYVAEKWLLLKYFTVALIPEAISFEYLLSLYILKYWYCNFLRTFFFEDLRKQIIFSVAICIQILPELDVSP